MNKSLLLLIIPGIGLLAAADLSMLFSFLIPAVFFEVALILISLHPDDDRRFLTRLFLLSFALRAGVGVLIYFFNLAGFFGSDAYTYDGAGALLAEYWSGQSALASSAKWFSEGAHPGYIYFVASLYYLGGQQPLVGQAVNWTLGSFTIYFTYLIAKKMFNRDVAIYAAVFAGLMPCFVIWEAQLLKDTIIIFALCMCIYAVMNLQERFSIFYALISVAALLILFFFRIYIFYIMGATSVLSFIVGQRMGWLPMVVIMTILFGGIALVAQQTGFLARMSEEQNRHFEGTSAFEKVDQWRKNLAGSKDRNVGSGYLVDADISTPGKALAFLPLGTIYLILAPFPWMMRNLRQAITLPEMLVWWYLFPYLIRGMIYGVKERFTYVSSPLLFSIGLTFMYALFQGNVGTAYRQRTQVFIFYFIFVSAGLLFKKNKDIKSAHNNILIVNPANVVDSKAEAS